MKRIGLKIAILAIVASTAAAWAGDGASQSVRNCTWCHGTSGQGYTVAPRLAGQRAQYIEGQIRSYREHTRDNPFSRQYMWGAVAALGPREAHDLAIYFATLTPKAANDGNRDIAAEEEQFISKEFRKPMLCPAMPVMARTPRASETFLAWEDWPIST